MAHAQGHALRGREELAEDHADACARKGCGSKPLAEAVQAVLLENLNMKTELEVLEQRVFRERLWKQDLQFVWIRWFMDYPDPHNEYFDTFYGKKTTGKRQAWVNDAFDKELEAGPRHARRQEAARELRQGRGDHADRRRLRAGGLGRALRRGQAVGARASRRTRRASSWSTATSTSTCSRTSTWSRRRSVGRYHGAPRRSRGAPSSTEERTTIPGSLHMTHIRPRSRPAS